MSNKLEETNAKQFLADLGKRYTPSDASRGGFRRQLAQKGRRAARKGEVGELIDLKIPVGDAVSLTTATAKTLGGITLSSGAWLLNGHANLSATSATRTAASAGFSETADTLPTDGTEIASGVQTTTATHKDGLSLHPQVVLVPEGSTKTIGLVASATFSAGTIAGYGQISALRIY